MYILKTPANVVYNTANKDFALSVLPDHHYVCPLGLVVAGEIFDYLLDTFGEATHSYSLHILTHFSVSNYYITNSLCDIP